MRNGCHCNFADSVSEKSVMVQYDVRHSCIKTSCGMFVILTRRFLHPIDNLANAGGRRLQRDKVKGNMGVGVG